VWHLSFDHQYQEMSAQSEWRTQLNPKEVPWIIRNKNTWGNVSFTGRIAVVVIFILTASFVYDDLISPHHTFPFKYETCADINSISTHFCENKKNTHTSELLIYSDHPIHGMALIYLHFLLILLLFVDHGIELLLRMMFFTSDVCVYIMISICLHYHNIIFNFCVMFFLDEVQLLVYGSGIGVFGYIVVVSSFVVIGLSSGLHAALGVLVFGFVITCIAILSTHYSVKWNETDYKYSSNNSINIINNSKHLIVLNLTLRNDSSESQKTHSSSDHKVPIIEQCRTCVSNEEGFDLFSRHLTRYCISVYIYIYSLYFV